MGTSDPTFALEDPVFFLGLLLAVTIGVKLDLWFLRTVGIVAGPLTRRAVWWGSVVVAAAVPLQALLVVILVVLVLHTIVGCAYLVATGTPWGRRTFLAPRIRRVSMQLITGDWELSSLRRLPWSVTSWTKELGRLGFVEVVAGTQRTGLTRAVMVRSPDGTIADIVGQSMRVDRPTLPVVTLISKVRAADGALTTSVLTGPDQCRSVVAQVLRFATPAKLLSVHDEGRQLLEDRGVRFERTPPDEAAGVVARLWSDALLATLDLSDDALLDRRKLLRRPPRTVAMLGEPAIAERIARMRGEFVVAAPGAGLPAPASVLGLPPPPAAADRGGTRTRVLAQALRGNLYRMGASGFSLAPLRSIPSSLARPAVAFEDLGFGPVAAGRDPAGASRVVLLRDDGAVARVTRCPGRRGEPDVSLDVISFLAGDLGCLSTGTNGSGNPPWGGEIGQVVPGATPRALVEAHDGGVRHLTALGARFEALGADDVADRLAWAATEACRALVALPDDALLSQVSTGPPVARTLPAMADDPVVAARIGALVPRPQEDRAGA